MAILVKYAAENQIPIHARGAGTDPGGGSIGPGLVLDFSRHMRRIISIGTDHVVAEPGIVLDHLNAELIPMGGDWSLIQAMPTSPPWGG